MAQWKRDPSHLTQAAAQFGGLADRLQEFESQFEMFEVGIGDGGVTGAVRNLLTNWSVERDRLVASLQGAASALARIAAQYESDEEELSAAASSRTTVT